MFLYILKSAEEFHKFLARHFNWLRTLVGNELQNSPWLAHFRTISTEKNIYIYFRSASRSFTCTKEGQRSIRVCSVAATLRRCTYALDVSRAKGTHL